MKKNNKESINIGLDNLKNFAQKGAAAEVFTIPTGHFNLDFALHFGEMPGEKDLSEFENYNPSKTLGLPLGRLVEIFGEEGSGKSSICYRIVGNAQKKGLPCLWFDAEQSFSESLAKINGVNLKNLWLSNIGLLMEEIIDNIIVAVQNGMKVIVVDSVAGLIPKARMEESSEQQFMALKARILSDNIPKIATEASKHGALVVFINQLRDKPGVMMGPSDTTTGGKALPFFSSVRLRFIKRTSAKEAIFIEDSSTKTGRKYIGQYSGLKIEKNRFAKPFVDSDGKKVILDVPIYFEPYFPNIEEIAFDVGRQLKVISVRNKVFKWNDITGTKDELIKKIAEDDKIEDLILEIKEAAKEDDDILVPAEILSYNKKNKVKRVKLTDEEISRIDKENSKLKASAPVPQLSIVSEPSDVLEDVNIDEQKE
jgi:protein RecA